MEDRQWTDVALGPAVFVNKESICRLTNFALPGYKADEEGNLQVTLESRWLDNFLIDGYGVLIQARADAAEGTNGLPKIAVFSTHLIQVLRRSPASSTNAANAADPGGGRRS